MTTFFCNFKILRWPMSAALRMVLRHIWANMHWWVWIWDLTELLLKHMHIEAETAKMCMLKNHKLFNYSGYEALAKYSDKICCIKCLYYMILWSDFLIMKSNNVQSLTVHVWRNVLFILKFRKYYLCIHVWAPVFDSWFFIKSNDAPALQIKDRLLSSICPLIYTLLLSYIFIKLPKTLNFISRHN